MDRFSKEAGSRGLDLLGEFLEPMGGIEPQMYGIFCLFHWKRKHLTMQLLICILGS